MKTKIKILTDNQDVGLTLLLWLADYLKSHDRPVVITDRNPQERGLKTRLAEDEIHVSSSPEGMLKIACSPDIFNFRKHPAIETLRKAQAKWNPKASPTSLDHRQVLQRQQAIRDQMNQSLGLSAGDKVCRFLLRVDGFPSTEADSESFLMFHQIARKNRVPYLVGVTPFGKEEDRQTMTDREIEILKHCIREGANVALQGFTREGSSEEPLELVPMSAEVFERSLKEAEDFLRMRDIWTLGYIAPFNAYHPRYLRTLMAHYELICGGPESVETIGYRAPSFLNERLYIPSYHDVYNLKKEDLPRLDQMIETSDGVVIPITIQWANESHGGTPFFEELCERLSDRTYAWDEYLFEARVLKHQVESKT